MLVLSNPVLNLFSSVFFILVYRQVWFKNRRAKFRKNKREENERFKKLQEEHLNNSSLKCNVTESTSTFNGLTAGNVANNNLPKSALAHSNLMYSYSDADDSSSDLEVA